MKYYDVAQNTPEWSALRIGRITASNMDCIISPTGKQSTQVDKYLNKLISEQITGESSDKFQGNVHTDRGHEYEQEAADYYSMLTDVELKKAGFCTTDDGSLGCSPDRFVGDDGVLEIKTGLPHIMIEYYLSGKLEQDHRPQTQSTLYITERQWIDTMLYNPLIKPIIIRSTRSDQFINDMVSFTNSAFKLMEEKKSIMKTKGFFTEEKKAA